MSDRSAPVVLYIAGWGRSGTTLLDALLGAEDGWFSCGELRHLWRDYPCGCRRRVTACGFWAGVLDEVLPGHALDFESAGLLHREALGGGSPTLAALRGTREGADGAGTAYSRLLADLYAELARRSGARVLVDSSKTVADAIFARHAGLEVRVLHLVRDPRAVAHSWHRSKPTLEQGVMLQRIKPARSSLHWMRRQALTETLLGRPAGRYMSLRYEELCADPGGVVARVRAFAGGASVSAPVEPGGWVELGPNHMAAGNPVRWQRGPVRVACDEEWLDRMPRGARLRATIPALPLLRRYGYRLRST